jgi:hypothetical protein
MTYYSSTLDKFLSPYGTFTCEEIDAIDRMEKEWRESLPDYSLQELLEIFPQAKTIVKKNLIAEIKQCNEDLLEADRIELEGKSKIEWQSRTESHWFWEGVLDVLLVQPFRNGREEKIKRNSFFLNSLKRKEEVKTSGVSSEQIHQAKQVPIKTFVKVNHAGFTTCPFHVDKTPSLKVYRTNDWYCFSCNAGGDVVDLVMKMQNVSFIDAVKYLTK